MNQQRSGGMASKSFCPLPWKHLATHPHGSITLCCESEQIGRQSESYDKNELIITDKGREYKTLHTTDYDFNKIHNSESFRQVRLDMLNGKRPSVCNKCWDSEDVGNTSKRLHELNRLEYTLEDAISETKQDGSIDVDYEFIELRLGNHCNLICRTCNPVSSSRWNKEWKLIGGGNSIPQPLFNWPLDEKFWDKLTEHSSKLRHVYINGGEPLLIDKHLKWLEYLVENDIAKNVALTYSTNTTVTGETYKEVWPHFKNVDFMLSIDCLEKRNEFMRYPSKWEKTLDGAQWFIDYANKHNNIITSICQTNSLINVYYHKEFYEYWEGKVAYISPNWVNDPDYYDARILPDNVKQDILDKIKGTKRYQNIKNYLSLKGDDRLLYKFFEKTNILDKNRKESYKDIFPEFYEKIRKYDV